jgi:ABC-type polysaccharide/polyol phosphate transport system ATPase subunit
MAYISLNNADVVFAVYNSKTRSVRNQLISAIGGKINSIDHTTYIRALNKITVEVKEGERIGLIGHNGAGKTTLLKVLAGIYEPTGGTIQLEGHISSLTDITMGMDPELSGYDNIIMRCIFMGLSFKEAKNKVNEIIDFSELHEYIDLPTRTYSTGMYLRLAFSISTAITPDILIMDEMIGAGDAAFIHKARTRISDLIKRTKIMVLSSHDLQIMKDTCNRGIWMEKGQIRMDGNMTEVIEAYKEFTNNKALRTKF